MDTETKIEYSGLAATVGRLMSSLKQTEAALAEAQRELAELKEKE